MASTLFFDRQKFNFTWRMLNLFKVNLRRMTENYSCWTGDSNFFVQLRHQLQARTKNIQKPFPTLLQLPMMMKVNIHSPND